MAKKCLEAPQCKVDSLVRGIAVLCSNDAQVEKLAWNKKQMDHLQQFYSSTATQLSQSYLISAGVNIVALHQSPIFATRQACDSDVVLCPIKTVDMIGHTGDPFPVSTTPSRSGV